jgi:AcrR family transcriptional regulator
MAIVTDRKPRQRNPRGQGEKLRDDIIEAASDLLADPASPPLTLRAVARGVGVAATSVYLHFDDVASLILAVAERRFGELAKQQDLALDGVVDPAERMRAGCLAYCEFGLAHPGNYQVMFVTQSEPLMAIPVEQMPGYAVFERLVDEVAAYQGLAPDAPEAFVTATIIWQQLHGIVSLRISRRRFPWPPLEPTVTDAITRILGAPTQ